jgi:phospholipid transport system substrate-binding protein
MTHAMSRRRLLAISALALGFAAFDAAGKAAWQAAWAAEAMDPAAARIQAFYDVLLAGMKQAQNLGVQGRYEKLAPAVRQTFDIPTMTRVAAGPSWNKIPPDKQQALIEAFERMTTASYASQFGGYSGQQFTVEPKTTPRSADVIVHSRLQPANGDPVAFNYLMRGAGPDWKIEDVYLDGTISQLAVRRSEFSAILGSEGPDGLLAKLKAQSDALLKSS